MYLEKLQKEEVQAVANMKKKVEIEHYGDLVDQAFWQFKENLKRHRTKFKMMKYQGQYISMEIIHKTQKQTKLL